MICESEDKSERTTIRFAIGIITCVITLTLLALLPSHVSAQQEPTIAGDYAGTLGPLHIRLHLKENAVGKVTGTLDSIDRGAMGIHCANFDIDGRSVTFTVPAVQGMWRGTLGPDGTLIGTWVQAHSLPLNFTRDTALQAERTLTASR
jgi:serine-type D-Ala-D-Ala carboxypeptidase/endopeptidase